MQKRTNSIIEVSKEAAELRKHAPSVIIGAYDISLQDKAIAAFPTVDRCSEVDSPQLGVLSEAFPAHIDKRTGEEIQDMAVVWMQGHLIAVSMFCGAREKMNEWQSKSLCNQIINEHPTLTLMEFILFCSRLRSAKYGKFYGSIDPAEILGSLDLFLKDKRQDIARHMEEVERQRREKEWEESRKNAITYEEFLRRKESGEYPTLSKLEQAEKQSPPVEKKLHI